MNDDLDAARGIFASLTLATGFFWLPLAVVLVLLEWWF